MDSCAPYPSVHHPHSKRLSVSHTSQSRKRINFCCGKTFILSICLVAIGLTVGSRVSWQDQTHMPPNLNQQQLLFVCQQSNRWQPRQSPQPANHNRHTSISSPARTSWHYRAKSMILMQPNATVRHKIQMPTSKSN